MEGPKQGESGEKRDRRKVKRQLKSRYKKGKGEEVEMKENKGRERKKRK